MTFNFNSFQSTKNLATSNTEDAFCLGTKSRSQCRAFKPALKQAYSFWQFRGFEKDELECVLGFKAATVKLLASNLKLRHAAIELLAGSVARLRNDALHRPVRRFWCGSFLGPLINERTPSLAGLDTFRADVGRLLQSYSFNAIVATELQALTNYPQRGHGSSFLLNAHAIMWSDDPMLDINKVVARMRASGGLRSELGAATVECTPRTLAPGQLEYLAYYILKPPLMGKYRRKDPDNSSRWQLAPTAVRPALLLRLAELLSNLELTDLVFGVGEGVGVCAEWKQRLRSWNEGKCRRTKLPLDPEFDTAGLWNGVRARDGNGSRLYRPLTLDQSPGLFD